MTRTKLSIPLLAATALFALAGCSSGAPAEPAETEAPVTLDTVWEEIGCKESDPMGSRGMIEEGEAPLTRTGTCSPFDSDKLAFFFELEDEAAARDWFESGGLEVGATDAVFIDGGVIMLATTASDAAAFAELYDPLS